MTLGYRGGGIAGPGFGIAISADDKVWVTSLTGKTISVFDGNTGRPLSPETGFNFGGQLGTIQGTITTPNGDVWALDYENDQIVYMPKGDAAKGRILARTVNRKPVDGPCHLASRTGSGSPMPAPTRSPASRRVILARPSRSPSDTARGAVAIDSLGNAWVADTVGHPNTREKLAFIKNKLQSRVEDLLGSASEADQTAKLWIDLFKLLQEFPGGDMTMIRPDGTVRV
jgi:hypothetical protein